MALTSASTTQQARDQYRNSLDYKRTASVSKAHDLREAILFLMEARAEVNGPGIAVKHRLDLLAKQLEEVSAFLDEAPSVPNPGPTVTHPDFREYLT